MTEYSAFLKHLGIDKKQMLASMWSKIPESNKPSKRGRDMAKEHTPEEIKYRLSDLGVQIGNIAINYITELEQENANLRALRKYEVNVANLEIEKLEAQVEKMKCCGNCSHFKLDNSGLYPIYVCELIYPNRCKNHDKWEIKEND